MPISQTHTSNSPTMPIDKSSGNQPPIGGSGECSNATLDFNSLVSVDMNQFTQSELYSLSLSTTDEPFDPTENDVTTNVIKSSHKPTCPIFTSTNSPRRIFAFFHWRPPSDSDSDDDDVAKVAENESILNSIHKSIAGGDTAAPAAGLPEPLVGDRPKRKRKPENGNEFEGLGVIKVQGDMIDLKYLARDGDGVFAAELNKRTEGMVAEEEFLGVIKSFDGRWGSNRRQRKFVDVGLIVKVLPVSWKVLLSLRPRARQLSLYCREFISPSKESFKSCKEVAFYLQSLFVTNIANCPEEGAIMLVEPDRQRDPESETRTKCIELKYAPVNGEGSSSRGPKNNSEMTGNLKTRCFLCLAEFIRKPVDPDTIPGSYGFICPKCNMLLRPG